MIEERRKLTGNRRDLFQMALNSDELMGNFLKQQEASKW